MLSLGAIGFTAPWLLLGLAGLPLLWLILRAVPPAPIRRRFPGVLLLLGLSDEDSQSDRTPWWLLLLRLAAIAAMIIAFAGPVLNPQTMREGRGDLVIVLDGSWAGAAHWPAQLGRVDALLAEAARNDRRVAIVTLTDLPRDDLPFAAPATWRDRLLSLRPAPWQPDPGTADWFADRPEGFETYWLSDGLDWTGRAALLAQLEARGPVSVFQTPRAVLALRPARYDEGAILISALRSPLGTTLTPEITAIGRDPAGIERVLARVPLTIPAGTAEAEARFDLPAELRNRVTRFAIAGARSAAGVSLTDDALKRREVALIAGRDDSEGRALLSPLHYLREALAPTADLIEGALSDILLANPDVIVLADVANLAGPDAEDLAAWVEAGGLLLRFAGPLLAASEVGRTVEDPLLPVRLRAGGRSLGGAMSWGEAKTLAPFAEDSPFYGLVIPQDVTVSSQVIAEPDPTLAARVIAQLSDGTPLVTRAMRGEGQVVLMHVTANAEWSSLPLSGLFVQMLERLAISTRRAAPDSEALAGTLWQPSRVLDAYGTFTDAATLAGVAGEKLGLGTPGPGLPPGLYRSDDRQVALNVIGAQTSLSPASWPGRISVEGLQTTRETALKGWVLMLGLLVLMVDVLASLALAGRLRGPRTGIAALLAALLSLSPEAAVFAQTPPAGQPTPENAEDRFALQATSQVVLAHVLTGDPTLDEIAAAGLRGLSATLTRRTAIEPAAPMGVDLETDELAFFPFLYWPVTADQPLPSRAAYAKLNRYLRGGGMIMFDTGDADSTRFGASSATGRRLQGIARSLDIPPLEPIPQDHVLTRSFYLLQDFPGRYAGRDVWVEAAPITDTQPTGLPFRTRNDGVTPVIIGGNDWARAWAVDAAGQRMFPVGRGMAGERQREIALRFGVNVIMHVLTGNYKSDQVHVPDLLDRLGQ